MTDSVFDVKGLSERVAGRGDVVDELVRMLRATFPDDRGALIARLDAADARGARDVAHRIKGQFQTLGLGRAAEQARRIEVLTRDGLLDQARSALADLDHEFQRFEGLVSTRTSAPQG